MYRTFRVLLDPIALIVLHRLVEFDAATQGEPLDRHAGKDGILDAGLGFGPAEGVDQLAFEGRIGAGSGGQIHDSHSASLMAPPTLP